MSLSVVLWSCKWNPWKALSRWAHVEETSSSEKIVDVDQVRRFSMDKLSGLDRVYETTVWPIIL